jgi:hypothetical protein
MSYLQTPTIIFTGDFQADVSTVNNDVRHYDNASFEKRFQDDPVTITGPDGKPAQVQNGWWNPNGGATFNFLNCEVKRCILPNGSDDRNNLLVGSAVTGPNDRTGGKLVDLDPQMQMTSELWAVRIRLSDKQGNLLLEGALDVTGFRDLQTRQLSGNPNGQALGASWVTVIRDVKWGDTSGNHQLLQQLKDATDDNCLSLSLASFGYYYNHVDGRFSMGKIIGTIGPWKRNTPVRFAPTRRLYGMVSSFFGVTNFIAEGDALTVDLGMSIPVQDPFGAMHSSFQKIVVAVSRNTSFDQQPADTPTLADPATFAIIGTADTGGDPQWMMKTGGIVRMKLNAEAQALVKNNQVLLLLQNASGYILLARESIGGWYVRCDYNVLRLDPGHTLQSDFYVYQWGKPVKNATVTVDLEPRTSGGGGGTRSAARQPKAPIPFINFPAQSISVPTPAKTDEFGRTTISVTGSDPRNPRGYIDGQLYFFSYGLEGVPNLDTYFNDRLIVHLRNAFEVPKKPTWKDVSEIWIQFGNLYPIMSKHIVNMSVAEEVLKRKDILLFAFTRDINDPMYMPVTRDLSANKMEALVKWLKEPLLDETADEPLVVKSQPQPILESALEESETGEESVLSRLTRAKGGDPAALSLHFPFDLI